MGFVRQLVMSFLWIGVLRAQEDRDKYFNVTLPSTITAQEGLCVLIPCTFTYEKTVKAAVSSRGYWFFEGAKIQEKAVATNDVNKEIHEHTRGRFRLVGDVRSRDCSLSINDVRKSDERSYFFRYEHNEHPITKYSYIRYPLRVTVTDLQDKPEISLPERVMEGETVTVRCVAPGRCSGTAPNITWGPESQFKYHQLLNNTDNPGGTKTYASTITFTALREHNSSRLHCTAYFPAVDKYTTNSVSLNVQYMNSSKLPLIPMIGGAIAGVVVLAGLCLLAWLMSRKVRRARDANKEAGDKKETEGDDLAIYSVVNKSPKGSRTENNPHSRANTKISKEEDMYENFNNDNLHYASIRLPRAKPESKYSPICEETLYSEVKVH
ncbi:myeloid cell surface antigen CD33-like [Pleurodeles waltl]|uniref:myeloid cell surface antigen CD33-like n=1 Tax=Pleurodeles waltl TaxID=8319 RepID=UPI00370999AB